MCFLHFTIELYRLYNIENILHNLYTVHQEICSQPPSSEQIRAWEGSIEVLKRLCPQLPAEYWLIFEFVLPRERGRRPDVILLSQNAAYVFEFKESKTPGRAHVDQVAAYCRDLAEYHAGSRGKRIVPLLVMTGAEGLRKQSGDVRIYSPDTLEQDIAQIVDCTDPPGDVAAFLEGDYEPLPSLVHAAKLLFEKEPLPQIRRAESVGIPDTLQVLHEYAGRALQSGEKVLALVTGVPGSGKTLVGLQFTYDQSEMGANNAVFLSGNGPLVEVLQYALKNKIFVQDVHGFLKQYGGGSTRIPRERAWIYDEAQRAWDDERAKDKRGPQALSEPNDFARLASRVDGGVMIIGLIGEGQEIHLGEEAGISQWNDALAAVPDDWTVVCPPHVAHVFTNAKQCVPATRLNLSASLRTHRASDLQEWVRLLLDGKLAQAHTLADTLREDLFPIYVTRNVESAKKHARERYRGNLDRRFGLLASSKAKNLADHGIPNDYAATKRVRKGPWFSDDPDHPGSCCQLASVATEFACQGLELDFPIVAWGDDLSWNGEAWASRPGGRSKAKNPHQLRLNSYRVLLTRGRDGMVIFVPAGKEMDASFEALVAAGCAVM